MIPDMTYTINVYLDDNRETPPGFVRTYTVADTLAILRSCSVDVLSLDNDLGIPGIENEGREVVRQLSEQSFCGWDRWPKRIRIHSANSAAMDYIRGMILRYGGYTYDGMAREFVREVARD